MSSDSADQDFADCVSRVAVHAVQNLVGKEVAGAMSAIEGRVATAVQHELQLMQDALQPRLHNLESLLAEHNELDDDPTLREHQRVRTRPNPNHDSSDSETSSGYSPPSGRSKREAALTVS